MNKRIRELRNALQMTMEQFGAVIGLSKSGISEIESGRRNVTEKHVRLLTSNAINGHNVNGVWLRTGKGDMFIVDDFLSLDEVISSCGISSDEKAFVSNFVRAYFSLRDETRREIISRFSDVFTPKGQSETWDGKTREELHAELDQALDAEKERWMAEAQPPSRDTMAAAG